MLSTVMQEAVWRPPEDSASISLETATLGVCHAGVLGEAGKNSGSQPQSMDLHIKKLLLYFSESRSDVCISVFANWDEVYEF